MRSRKRRLSAQRAGFTIVEMLVSVSILGMFSVMLVGASNASGTMTEMGNVKARILRQSQKATSRILSDLRKTGFVSLNGQDYPHVFDNGVPATGFEAFAYEPAPGSAREGEADFGTMRSMILSLPSDLDGDGRPEIDANGNGIPELDGDGDGTPSESSDDLDGVWDADEVVIHPDSRLSWSRHAVAYIVTASGPNGEKELVRVVGGTGGEREVLAQGVERIQFDTPESSGFAIPTGTIRATIYFRVTGPSGIVYRSTHTFRVGTQG